MSLLVEPMVGHVALVLDHVGLPPDGYYVSPSFGLEHCSDLEPFFHWDLRGFLNIYKVHITITVYFLLSWALVGALLGSNHM